MAILQNTIFKNVTFLLVHPLFKISVLLLKVFNSITCQLPFNLIIMTDEKILEVLNKVRDFILTL